jgi:hypothetical protein
MPPIIFQPLDGSILTSNSVTVVWTDPHDAHPPTNVVQWWLRLSSYGPNGPWNIYNADEGSGTNDTVTVPTNGGSVWAQIRYKTSPTGNWANVYPSKFRCASQS